MAKPKKSAVVAPPDSAALTQIDDCKEIVASEVGEIKAACRRAGLSIDDYVGAIKEALLATKYGGEGIEVDHTTRLKGALMGLELEGYIKNKAVTQDNRKYTQVIYKWGENE